ncbi:MAG: type II secretion system F family protein [Alphaproteobacteria bacterium]|nr:MAG: type II secretion system F family protein [Alphaproteobacteria bacterium]
MPQFRYRAVSPRGRVREGVEEAPTRERALQALRARGLVPLKLEPARDAGGVRAAGLHTAVRRGGRRRFDATARALLIRELAALVAAGMPLADALAALERSGGGAPAVAMMAGRLLKAVREGRALSQAMAEAGDEAFPPFVRGLVRAGEASGKLSRALARIADALEAQLALTREIRSALTYPALVVIVAAAAVAILLFAVVPEFAGLFADRTAALPASARLIFWLSATLRSHGLEIAIATLGGFLALVLWWRDPRRRASRDGWLLRLPRIGSLIRLHAGARFLQTLGELLAGGVALVPAFELAQQAIGNRALEDQLHGVLPHLRQGRSLAESLKETSFLDPLTREMLAAGEQAGALAEMALHAAQLAQDHVRRQVRALIALLVPAVTLLLGVIVAGIVGSMLSAILASYDVAF